jgi:hypothetical protein
VDPFSGDQFAYEADVWNLLGDRVGERAEQIRIATGIDHGRLVGPSGDVTRCLCDHVVAASDDPRRRSETLDRELPVSGLLLHRVLKSASVQLRHVARAGRGASLLGDVGPHDLVTRDYHLRLERLDGGS